MEHEADGGSSGWRTWWHVAGAATVRPGRENKKMAMCVGVVITSAALSFPIRLAYSRRVPWRTPRGRFAIPESARPNFNSSLAPTRSRDSHKPGGYATRPIPLRTISRIIQGIRRLSLAKTRIIGRFEKWKRSLSARSFGARLVRIFERCPAPEEDTESFLAHALASVASWPRADLAHM